MSEPGQTLTVVTSCSAEGWRTYGRLMAETFDAMWPEGVRLLVYSEDAIPELLAHSVPRASWLPLLSESTGCAEFLERHRGNLAAQGRRPVPRARWKEKELREGYNFRYDAYKFARKVFAIEAAARRTTTPWLLWLDADVMTVKDVRWRWLESCLRGDLAFLDRSPYHSECGFVAYRVGNPDVREFINDFAALYATDRVFDLAEWHDSWVFDWLRRQRPRLRGVGLRYVSASAPVDTMVEMRGALRHLKGRRKYEEGRRLDAAGRR